MNQRMRSPLAVARCCVGLTVLLAAGLGGCLQDNFADGFPCSNASECPAPFQCQAGKCYRHDRRRRGQRHRWRDRCLGPSPSRRWLDWHRWDSHEHDRSGVGRVIALG
jgi:hypothetical protein